MEKLINMALTNIPKYLKNDIALFADYAALITVAFTLRQTNPRLQRHFEVVLRHLYRWILKLNPEKTELINIYHKQNLSKIKHNNKQ